MNILSFQHVPFEDIGSMQFDLQQLGHSVNTTHWYQGDQPPALANIDLLIVMGGPMGVYDEQQFPWLADEKIYIAAAIAAGKKVLGICLGAQLIACVLGAKVFRNKYREIGWFPLQMETERPHPIATILKQCANVFHWHGDTFELPTDAILIASSAACKHQAFIVNERIFGFQFHLEITHESANALIKYCAGDLDNSVYVQTAESIMQSTENFKCINNAMSAILLHILN